MTTKSIQKESKVLNISSVHNVEAKVLSIEPKTLNSIRNLIVLGVIFIPALITLGNFVQYVLISKVVSPLLGFFS